MAFKCTIAEVLVYFSLKAVCLKFFDAKVL
jgi:hypothetical protein